jgi:transcriptional regulator of aromatic amino acid metabolism
MLQYYSSRLAFRPFEKDFSPILYSKKLLHQYIVDAFVKDESNRINCIKTHQSELYVEQYKGLMDFVRNKTGVEAIGRVTIMPSKFQVLFY